MDPTTASGTGSDGAAGGSVTDLERALASLQRSFDDAPAGVAVATADGHILSCNVEFARIAGFASVEEALETNIRSLEKTPGSFRGMLERLRESPLIPLEELHFIRHDGVPSHALVRLVATVDDGGEVSEIRVYLVDITQRYEEETLLRQHVELYRLAELATRDVLWDWDLNTGKISWNEAVAMRFRYDPAEVRQSLDWHLDHIHPEDRERILRGLERAVLGVNGSWSDEYRFRRGDGTWAAVLDRAHIVRNGRGQPVRAVGWILDISELKASEDAQRFLAEASGVLDQALELEPTARALARAAVPALADFCLVDLIEPDGALRRVAVAHENEDRESLLREGTSVPAEPDAGEFAPWGVIRLAEGEYVESSSEEAALRLNIAPEVAARAFLVAPIVAAGKVLGTSTFGLASTGRSWDAQHLVTLRELARRAGIAVDHALLYEAARGAAESRDELLRAVSHDLRDPLHTIVQSIGLLGDLVPARNLEIHRWLDVLRHASQQMRTLLESLLDSARIDAGQFIVEPEEANPTRTLLDACEMLRPLAEAKGQRIEAKVPDDLPEIPIDAPQIIRVVGNLLGNAIKFSEPGGAVRLAAEIRGAELVVSIADEGNGIPPGQVAHVFDRFWKGSRRDRRGVGLGLTICKGIVEAHGGRIWVESREGEGSTFSFALPTTARVPAGEVRHPSRRWEDRNWSEAAGGVF